MKEKKRDKTKRYEIDMLQHAKKMIGQTGIFSSLPMKLLSYVERKLNREETGTKSLVEIQRGIVRTNCIDSLDRTNQVQTLIGYYGVLVQLKKLGVAKEVEINLNSEFYAAIHTMYETMGDSISMQYGGSKAHHSAVVKKKGVLASIPELVTSMKRHYANNFTDPQKQNALNLFLGIYQPLKNKSALWTINDDRELMMSMDLVPSELKKLQDKWWERHFRGFEAGLPSKLINNLLPIFNHEANAADDGNSARALDDESGDKFKLSTTEGEEESLIFTFGQDDEALPESIRESFRDKASKGETFVATNKQNCDLLQQVNQMRDSVRQSSSLIKDNHNSSRISIRASHLTSETSMFANSQMSYLQKLSKAIRSKTTKEFKASEINQNNDDYDSDELNHYCHSDADDFQDPDPFFEYNKCHMCSFLQKKVEDPIYIYEPVRISNTFGLPNPVFDEPKTNITGEIEQITR